MGDNVNVRIIKKIQSSSYEKNVKDFLIWAIREEVANKGNQWIYKDEYEKTLSRLAEKER